MKLTRSEIDRILQREAGHDCPGIGEQNVCVRIVAIADLPSRFGRFQIAAFWNNRDAKEHIAIMKGKVFGREAVPTRVHSACLTGDGLGSLRCDCRDQLEASLRFIAAQEYGLMLSVVEGAAELFELALTWSDHTLADLLFRCGIS